MNNRQAGDEMDTKSNKFSLNEWAGAFGDLGIFIPYVIGYVAIVGINPVGLLFSFGILMIGSGLFYKTPMPIQPMKAIGGAAIASGGAITPAVIWGAGIATGLMWLILGLSGSMKWISKLVTKPVLQGIMLGLGLAFMLESIRMIKTDLLFGLLSIAIILFLNRFEKFPSIFAVLLFGLILAVWQQPALATSANLTPHFKIPSFALPALTWDNILTGALILALPQMPLTLGNAIVALTAENNRLFPTKEVSERKIALSHGVINLVSPILGGVPVCHGVGGLAGHTRFGAKTGGAMIILGSILITLSLFFSSSLILLLEALPKSTVGVLLFFAGLELAVGTRVSSRTREDFVIIMVTAVIGLSHMGIGFIAGVLLQQLIERKLIKV